MRKNLLLLTILCFAIAMFLTTLFLYQTVLDLRYKIDHISQTTDEINQTLTVWGVIE